MSRLRIETLLAIDELPDGSCLVYPVIEPEHASLGSEADAIAEVRLFLAEELSSESNPARIARFAIPDQAEPVSIEVVLPERDLPERFRRGVEVTMNAVAIPHGDAQWVLVPSLRHTIYVAKGETLQEVITHELRRHLDAIEPDVWMRAMLLPPLTHRLERVSVWLDRPDLKAGGTRQLRKDLDQARSKRHAAEVLRSVATPLHADARVMEGPPVVGRDALCTSLDALLSGETRRAVLLVGAQRVGKSAVLHQWLRQHDGRRVYQTSGAQLIAGMSGLGQWQQRLRRVIEAAEILDAVLYFDDLSDLFDRSSGKGSVDIPGAMKSALEEGRVRMLGELDEQAADLLSSQNEGFFASFHTVLVPPTDRAQARDVLRARSEHAQGTRIRDDAREAILALCDRYVPYRPFPGKAAELFDQVVASAERPGVALDAAEELRASDVYRLFSLQTGIPEFLLREDRALDPDRLRQRFAARLVGQEPAVRAVADTLCVVKAGLQAGDKPLATFLFVGPTGVGKTELARALAEVLYGAKDRLIRFDMSEYGDGLASQRLIAGGDGEGLLTRAVREQPFAVVLLDEIEKAHPSVFDLLLQVTGEGRLTDARGKTAFFHNTMLIMTSNIGASHRLGTTGFASERSTDLAGHYTREVQRWFRPEFVNRLDRIIPFATLDRNAIATITHMTVERFAQRRGLADRGIALEVTPAALERLATDGFDEAYGARALRRHLEDALAGPVASVVAGMGARARGVRLVVRCDEESLIGESLVRESRGGLLFDALPSEAGKRRNDHQALVEVGVLRRECDQLMRLPSVEVHREELHTLLAQLSAPRSKSAAKRAGGDIARMQTDHHRLDQRWRALIAQRDEVWALEELAFVALFEREEFPSAEEEIRTLKHRFRMELLQLLLDTDPQHEITVMCEELDDGRTLDIWLRTLCGDLGRRKWSAKFHIFKDPRAHGERWPPIADAHPWGPACTPDQIVAFLDRESRDRAVVLLRLKGPDAGTHLALESGLHRHFGVPPRSQGAHHQVRIVAMRSRILDDEWAHPALAPLGPPSSSQALRLHAGRWTDVRPNRKLPSSYVDIPLDEYWTPENADELGLRDLINIDRSHDRDRSQLYSSPLDAKSE